MKEIESMKMKCEAKLKNVSVLSMKPMESYLKGTISAIDENIDQQNY